MSMNVGQLIEALQRHDPKSTVMMSPDPRPDMPAWLVVSVERGVVYDTAGQDHRIVLLNASRMA